MAKFVNLLALGLVLCFVIFVIRRIIRFFSKRRQSRDSIHEDLLETADDIAGASRVAATLSSAAAFAVAPTGWLAVGAGLGVVPTPLITKLVPLLVAFAAGAAALSALAKLYAKAQQKRN